MHTHTSKGGFIGRAAARLAGTPVVLHTAHGFGFHETSRRRSVTFYAGLERLAARWSDHVITVSNIHREWALRLGIARPEKIVAIHNGISRERIEATVDRREMREALGIDEGSVVLTSIARLAEQKGLECLIEAMRRVTETYPAAELILVGDGPLAQASKSSLATSVSRTRFGSSAFETDVGDILNASDIVIAPSLREGLSIAILESMAVDKADRGEQHREQSRADHPRAGGPARPDDLERFSAAIVRLLADPEWAEQLGANARARFDREFTEDRMKRSVWEYNRTLLPQKSLSPMPETASPGRLHW